MTFDFNKTNVESNETTTLIVCQVYRVMGHFRGFCRVFSSVMALGAVAMSIWPTGATVSAAVTAHAHDRSKEQYGVDLGTPDYG